jgi:hypothetical protein
MGEIFALEGPNGSLERIVGRFKEQEKREEPTI